MKKTTKFEQIQSLISLGLSNAEIANVLHTTTQNTGYIRKVRRMLNQHPDPDTRTTALLTLTPKRYYKAIWKHDGTKEELAAKLGVSRMTLNKYEKATGINKQLAEYLHIQGMSINEIARILGTKVSTLKNMGLAELPTLSGIKKQMERALSTLGNVANLEERIAIEYDLTQKAYDKFKLMFHAPKKTPFSPS